MREVHGRQDGNRVVQRRVHADQGRIGCRGCPGGRLGIGRPRYAHRPQILAVVGCNSDLKTIHPATNGRGVVGCSTIKTKRGLFARGVLHLVFSSAHSPTFPRCRGRSGSVCCPKGLALKRSHQRIKVPSGRHGAPGSTDNPPLVSSDPEAPGVSGGRSIISSDRASAIRCDSSDVPVARNADSRTVSSAGGSRGAELDRAGIQRPPNPGMSLRERERARWMC